MIESELISEIFVSIFLDFDVNFVRDPAEEEMCLCALEFGESKYMSLCEARDFFSKRLSDSDFLLPISQPKNEHE